MLGESLLRCKGASFSVGLKLALREELRHPGPRGWGNSGWFWLRLRLWMTCTTFGSSVSAFVHQRVLDRARISTSFKHFDFKKCLHDISCHKMRHDAFASRLLILLHLIFFRSRLAFFTAPRKKNPGPSRSGSVPSWQHHLVTLIDVSRGLWNSKKVRWPFRCVIH